MPTFVLCYVCGRKYGTKSIEIHEPQCLEKWHVENAKLPPNIRRPAPKKPDLHIGSKRLPWIPLDSQRDINSWLGGGSYTLDQINDAAYEASKAQLVPCDNCGRKFAADRIQVHQRSCRPGNAAKSIGVGSFLPIFRTHSDSFVWSLIVQAAAGPGAGASGWTPDKPLQQKGNPGRGRGDLHEAFVYPIMHWRMI